MFNKNEKTGLLPFVVGCGLCLAALMPVYAADRADSDAASSKAAAADKKAEVKGASEKETARDTPAAAKGAAKQSTATASPSPAVTARSTQSDGPASIECPPKGHLRDVRVTRAYKAGEEGNTRVQLRDNIVVKVSNLITLLAAAECSTPPRKVVLFLDGRPIDNLSPFPPTDPTTSELRFPLRRDEKSREAWTAILGRPTWDARPTQLSVGVDGQYPVSSDVVVQLEVIPHDWFAAWSIVFLLLLTGFLMLGAKSDVLRDSGPPPAAGSKMYSLSRVQAAYWFFLILASYLFLWLITGDYSTTITGTVLVLTGISAGTTLGAAVIDSGQKRASATAAAAGAAAPAAPPAPAATVSPATSGWWWTDIVSDANGVSFPRFQMAVWTLVLGIMFIISVYRDLAMPTFNETLLGLLGISAGTYLGLKTTESK